MSESVFDPVAAWEDATLSAEIFAVDPFAIGGILLRAAAGPPRDQICAWLRTLLQPRAPLLRLPLHITEDRLLGGLALAATLRAGQVIFEKGILAQAHGGAVIAAMAERLEPELAAQLCAVLDRGALHVERDGVTAMSDCRLGVVALDEGIDEEQVSTPLRDRLALQLDLTALPPSSTCGREPDALRTARARELFPHVSTDEERVTALCHVASSLGIASIRAAILAVTVARAHAALCGRSQVEDADCIVAARLVLSPRATQLPELLSDEQGEGQEDVEPEPESLLDPANAPAPNAQETPSEPDKENPSPQTALPLQEILLDAARSAVPKGLLDALMLGREPKAMPRSTGKSGVLRSALRQGRPAGVRSAEPGGGVRLNIVETLRAAAPWQTIRRRERQTSSASNPRPIEIRKDDFRVTRLKQRQATSVIFSVDASGSAALQRLAEAKGAVEQVLADCYVRRDLVALIAFRCTQATLLLPPTRSLVRVRRCLADLAGGGTTPLAAGIDAALSLAILARKRGQTPILVIMTDGRGNIARDGRQGRAAAAADALSGAQAVRAAGVRTLFLDTSLRPQAPARRLALQMGAHYLPLPHLDAMGISRNVQSLIDVQ